MKSTTTVITVSLLAALSAASPLVVPRQQEDPATQPCAAVAGLVAAATQKSSGPVPTIPAQAAWDCLQSVPLNKTAALDLLKSVRPFVRWQSTLANLADPPAEYYAIQGAYDPINAMDIIEGKLNSGELWVRAL